MNNPEIDLQANTGFSLDISEVKKQVLNRDLDDSLSEWDRARMTSKTWSMEQDKLVSRCPVQNWAPNQIPPVNRRYKPLFLKALL
jgi:hypothetical protein